MLEQYNKSTARHPVLKGLQKSAFATNPRVKVNQLDAIAMPLEILDCFFIYVHFWYGVQTITCQLVLIAYSSPLPSVKDRPCWHSLYEQKVHIKGHEGSSFYEKVDHRSTKITLLSTISLWNTWRIWAKCIYRDGSTSA